MTYTEYRNNRQREFNKLPIFYAFSNEQFNEAMKERGLNPETDKKKLYRLGDSGGFYLKSDAEKVENFFKRNSLNELMKDYEFAKDAFYYEMCNHEYGINYYQGNWDVISCFWNVEYDDSDDFNLYFDTLKTDEIIRKAYKDARKKYYHDADANDWF